MTAARLLGVSSASFAEACTDFLWAGARMQMHACDGLADGLHYHALQGVQGIVADIMRDSRTHRGDVWVPAVVEDGVGLVPGGLLGVNLDDHLGRAGRHGVQLEVHL
jgi:hypothetical protein